jgi:hypothetical protein
MATIGDLGKVYNQVNDLRERGMIPEVCFAEFLQKFRSLRDVLIHEHEFESVLDAAARSKPETPLGAESQQAYEQLSVWLWRNYGITA